MSLEPLFTELVKQYPEKENTFVYFDTPLMYIIQDEHGNDYIVNCLDETEQHMIWSYTVLEGDFKTKLLNQELSLRNLILDENVLTFIVEVPYEGSRKILVRRAKPSDIPEVWLPYENSFLGKC